MEQLAKMEKDTPSMDEFKSLETKVDDNWTKYDSFKYHMEKKVRNFETIQADTNKEHRDLISYNSNDILK